MLVVGFDIETGSATHLHRWKESEPYLVLGGAIVNGKTVISTDFSALVDFLHRADIIYGHNILGFDIPALVKYAGADWDNLSSKAIDTLPLAQYHEPPAPKGLPPVLYDLDTVAARLGVPGKKGDVRSMAKAAVEAIADRETEGLEKKEATAVRKEIREKYKEIGGYHLIPQDQLRPYLEGDLRASEGVYHKLRHLMDVPYVRREMAFTRVIQYMAHASWRADLDLLEQRVKEEDEKVLEACEELVKIAPGIPSNAKSPLSTKEGRPAFEKALLEAGVSPENIPRTPKTGSISTCRDALSTGDWVVDAPVNKIQFNRRTAQYEKVTRTKRTRKKGLRQLYPENKEVHRLCELATTVSGKARKYREILDHVDDEGKFYSSIGAVQVSGRFAMTDPSITNIGKRGASVLAQREVFIPRNEDEVLLCVDLSQGDMRVVAALSGCPDYAELFQGDRDAHSEIAERLLGSRSLRKPAKAIGHGVNYGMGVDSTVANTGVDRELVERYFSEMETMFPRKAVWTREVREEAKTGMIKDNGWGRPMRTDPEQAYTQGPALYGQSGTREILVDGILRLPREIQKMLVAIVHDEVVLSVPKDRFDEIAETVKNALTCVFRGIEFTCGVSVPGRNWAECYADD